jgi:hypothetical protein
MIKYDGIAVDTTDQIIRCAIEVHRHLGPIRCSSLECSRASA